MICNQSNNHPRLKLRLIGLSVVAVLMAGCKTVGPDYQRPEVSLPATYAEGVSQVSQTIAENWWTHYQDPILNDLVGQALVNNSNIKLAVARIEAVSYTHLDVYKRQDYGWKRICFQGNAQFCRERD